MDLFAPGKAARRVDTQIRLCFLRFFVEVLHDYRRFVFYRRKYPYPVVWFARSQFIASQPSDLEAFLSVFLDSQAFNMFLEAATLQRPNLFDRACLAYNTGGGLLLPHVASNPVCVPMLQARPSTGQMRDWTNCLAS